MKASFVLDSSALLAWLFGEPGKELVTSCLKKGCLISSVNWCEVVQKAAKKGISSDRLYEELNEKQILNVVLTIEHFTESFARAAAAMFDLTKPYGLSLGDRACLAFAQERNVSVLTADTDWAKVELPINVQLIR